MSTTSARAGEANTFAGHATPGASFRVLNASGTEIVSGGPFFVEQDGTWTFERVVSRGAASFRFRLEQTAGDRVEASPLFTIAAS